MADQIAALILLRRLCHHIRIAPAKAQFPRGGIHHSSIHIQGNRLVRHAVYILVYLLAGLLIGQSSQIEISHVDSIRNHVICGSRLHGKCHRCQKYPCRDGQTVHPHLQFHHLQAPLTSLKKYRRSSVRLPQSALPWPIRVKQ